MRQGLISLGKEGALLCPACNPLSAEVRHGTTCSSPTSPQELPWLHGHSSWPGVPAGTKLELMGVTDRDSSGSSWPVGDPMGYHLRDLPPGRAGAAQEAAPEAVCQPLPGSEHRFLSAAPAHGRWASTTCSFHSSLPGSACRRRQESRGTGPFGRLLESDVCSEQAVPSSDQTWFSAAGMHREPIMRSSQVLALTYKTHLSRVLRASPATKPTIYAQPCSRGGPRHKDHMPAPEATR